MAAYYIYIYKVRYVKVKGNYNTDSHIATNVCMSVL